MPTSPENPQTAARIPSRSAVDACPGALQLHQAADGALARVRLPGGTLTPDQMLVLSKAAQELGNGSMELTSRGNVQLRSVSDSGELARCLADAGLLPSMTHERVRNIVASPLSGRIGGLTDVRPMIGDLDAAVRSNNGLAELPGRVLFSIDDGRGDMADLRADFGVQAVSDDLFAMFLAGEDCGLRIAADEVVSLLIASAEAFLAVRSSEWRLSEVPDGVQRVVGHVDHGSRRPRWIGDVAQVSDQPPPIGWLQQQDGRIALGGGLEMGRISSNLAQFLAAIGAPLTVTPWRTLMIFDLEEDAAEDVVRVLAPMGLVFDASSAWVSASACTGRPGCARSLADVQADLRAAVDARMVPTDERQHWSGCERRCGRPGGTVTDVVATGRGYRVS